ncbi:MAG: 3-deoxy-D-manno-octulosonic acid transferase [Candidatus Eisenbacteria bacterium]|nr:3-deoxy-D-manno-octulosonic acid transferase [Candidatus Eisenbacteria bacterium]
MSEGLYRIGAKAIEVISPLLLPLWVRDRGEREERLGRWGDRIPGGVVWMHAASAGETEGAEPIAREIRRAAPEAPILITSMTRAGRRRAGGIEGIHGRFVPVDTEGAVRRALEATRPRLLLLIETEIWPNLIRVATENGVPVALANGRISRPAFRRMRAARPLYRAALGRIRLFGVQRETDRERFLRLGAPEDRLFVHGNTKMDTDPPDPPDPGVRGGPEERWVVFGSVRDGEEEAVLGAIRALLARDDRIRVAVAPRHPDESRPYRRATEIPWRLWSEKPGAGARAILIDTVGDLLSFYGIADVAFVGGSLSRHGGHNPIEPARFGVPVLIGPHRENCAEAANLLLDAGGAREIRSGEELAIAAAAWLDDPEERARRGRAARGAVEANRGAAAALVRRLVQEGLLGRGEG